MAAARLRTAVAALCAVCSFAAVKPDVMVAAGDIGQSSFQLLRVDFNNATAYTPLGGPVSGFVLALGAATCTDMNGTFYAVLTAAPAGTPQYANSSLFAFNVSTGAVSWRYDFPANYTMDSLAWEPSLQQVVGLCGALLSNGTVQGYCGFSPATRTLRLIADWQWSLMYDPDTRALDPQRHRYYHRLYNSTWMPDWFVTLDSRTGELLQYCQFFGPEFSGTRVDTASGAVYSVCNADAGLDLCVLDPATGGMTPLNVFDRKHESSELFAATAAIDAAAGLYLLAVDFAVEGMATRAVDIAAGSPTYGTIVANYSVPSNPWPSNYHVIGAPDDVAGM